MPGAPFGSAQGHEPACGELVEPVEWLAPYIGGATSLRPPEAGAGPLLAILSGSAPPSDAYVAVPYKSRWFWIADTDVRNCGGCYPTRQSVIAS